MSYPNRGPETPWEHVTFRYRTHLVGRCPRWSGKADLERWTCLWRHEDGCCFRVTWLGWCWMNYDDPREHRVWTLDTRNTFRLPGQFQNGRFSGTGKMVLLACDEIMTWFSRVFVPTLSCWSWAMGCFSRCGTLKRVCWCTRASTRMLWTKVAEMAWMSQNTCCRL